MPKFYLNRTRPVFTCFFCWTGIPFLLGIIAGIRFAFMSDKSFQATYNPTSDEPNADTHVRCPDCRELVRMDAKKCKHCGAALIPQSFHS